MTNTRVIRCNSKKPSPFLVAQEPRLKQIAQAVPSPLAMDVGCGAGRNSEYLKTLGFRVQAFDLKPDYGEAIDLEQTDLPVQNNSVNVILLQYVVMFLSESTRQAVFAQCLNIATSPCLVVVETQDIKNGIVHGDELAMLLATFRNYGEIWAFQHKRTAGRLLLWRGL